MRALSPAPSPVSMRLGALEAYGWPTPEADWTASDGGAGKMTLVIPRLFLGSEQNARDLTTLHQNGITHILSVMPLDEQSPDCELDDECVGVLGQEEKDRVNGRRTRGPEEASTDAERAREVRGRRRLSVSMPDVGAQDARVEHATSAAAVVADLGTEADVPQHGASSVAAATLKRLVIPVLDLAEEELFPHFMQTNAFIDEGRANGGVLVHCQMGISRSATVVAAYLLANHAVLETPTPTPAAAISFLVSKRPMVAPNWGFREQLTLYHDCECDLPPGGASEEQKHRAASVQRKIQAWRGDKKRARRLATEKRRREQFHASIEPLTAPVASWPWPWAQTASGSAAAPPPTGTAGGDAASNTETGQVGENAHAGRDGAAGNGAWMMSLNWKRASRWAASVLV
uniref:Dual specificity phosphatase n=1 Tax=Mycena chlorophos TaxID=658473 RepID=A0ABQ0LTX8_MYCCL|nr:dual specificity phosphatase [Mycena chlorophos]